MIDFFLKRYIIKDVNWAKYFKWLDLLILKLKFQTEKKDQLSGDGPVKHVTFDNGQDILECIGKKLKTEGKFIW